MRGTTQIVCGLRNIGDAKDSGQFKSGGLKEVLYWLISELGQRTIATRFQISIARTEEEAAKGIQLQRRSGGKLSESDMAILDELFDDETFTDSPTIQVQIEEGIDPLDTYKGVKS